MPYVVTENCVQCKHTDCVSVCPVNCFHEGGNFLAIDPDECIDCGICEPECPVQAIKPDDQLKPSELHFLKLNRDLSAIWPVITAVKAALPDAERWANVEGKLEMLEH
ncbi:ferredoxin [Oxalobacteraceae bacterium GrIS 1.11]